MKKALQLASVASMIDQFNIPNIKLMISMGYQVDVVADYTNPGNISKERAKELIKKLKNLGANPIDIPIPRSMNPLKISKAYSMVKKLVVSEHYDIIHCHSPIGGVIARIAAKSERKNGTKVIYTAHGFHFYSGAPLKNWLLFYPIEKMLSRYTDILITINKEDYKRAKQKFNADRIIYLPGIGIDTKKFCKNDNGKKIRDELGLKKSDIVLLSVGELNDNKNHETVIKALSKLETIPQYVIVGRGDKKDYLQKLINDLKLDKYVKLVGFREDVIEFYKAADIFVFPSFREGLSVALMEAMASGLPVLCGKIRGNTDLIDCNGGVFFNPYKEESVKNAIKEILNMDLFRLKKHNLEKIRKFDIKIVENSMYKIYKFLEN